MSKYKDIDYTVAADFTSYKNRKSMIHRNVDGSFTAYVRTNTPVGFGIGIGNTKVRALSAAYDKTVQAGQ